MTHVNSARWLSNPIEVIATILLILGGHIDIAFTSKVNILMLINTAPLIMLTIRMVIII